MHAPAGGTCRASDKLLLCFEDYALDTDRRELHRGAVLLSVEPQVFDLLVFLVGNRDRVVSKDDMLASVWGGRIVSESTIASRINAVRRAIGDNGEKQRMIRTIIGKGVRFVGAVRKAQKLAMIDEGLRTRNPAIADEPSIAVMPFANMSGDPEQEYFADGMVEEIITALSRIKWLFVIARNSTFMYKDQAIDAKLVGRELGVRYVLEGSVRKSRDRVRVTAQLIDAQSGAHLWADRFDGSLEDVFELQDRVATSVAGVIEPALQAAEIVRSAGRPTSDLTAYDLYLRAFPILFSASRRITEALRLLEDAIERDPHYGPALAWAAFCHYRLCLDGRSDDPEADCREGVDLARRGLQVGGDDPGTLANAALALAYFGEDLGAMMALVDRALMLNPSFARGWHISGTLRLWAGQPDLAIAHVEASLRLSPRARLGMSFSILGAAHFFSRRFEEAVPKLLLAIQEDPNYPPPYRSLAACYTHMGRLDDAREIVGRLRVITPVVMPNIDYLQNTEQRELYLSGLRQACTPR
jgi:TolB-like protein